MPITAAAGEYKSRIGLDSLYIAEVTADTSSGYTADTPEYFAPAAEASQEPTSSFEIQYADDQPYDVSTSEGETKVNISVTNLPIAMLAKITGRVFDATTGRMYDNGAEAPYIALSFRALKSNGSYHYYQYLKGKFDMPKEDGSTKAESPDPKVMQLTYTAIRTTYAFDLGDINDSVKRVVGDEDTANFSATGWFGAVQTPVVGSYSALALSSSTPTDAATGVSITANQTLTFNNMLASNSENNVALLDATNTVVAGAITIDATRKIITINPTAALAGTAANADLHPGRAF